jgi:hypothetical protein
MDDVVMNPRLSRPRVRYTWRQTRGGMRGGRCWAIGAAWLAWRRAARRRGWRRCPDSCAGGLVQGLPAERGHRARRSDDELMAAWRCGGASPRDAYAEKSGAKDLAPAVYLAISGGGENGAYGAGVLTGWSALGTRPTFKGVTGVSTGALIAPFAFPRPVLRQGAGALLHHHRPEGRDGRRAATSRACWANRSTIRRRCCA